MPRARKPFGQRRHRQAAANGGAIASASPARTSSAFSPSRKHFTDRRQVRCNDRTPRRHVLEQLERGREARRDRRRRVRQDEHRGFREVRRQPSAGGTSPVNVTRSVMPSSVPAFTRARSGSAAWPPTISPRTSGPARSRAAARRRPSTRRDVRRSRRPVRRAAGLGSAIREPHAVRHNRELLTRPEPSPQVVGERLRDRDVAVRTPPHLRLAIGEPLQLGRRSAGFAVATSSGSAAATSGA